MFSLPVPGSQGAEGTRDDNPIVLQDTSSWEFKQLLRAMFFRTDVVEPNARGTPPSTFNEWVAVIKLTHRWEMHAMHEFAIEQAAKLCSAHARTEVDTYAETASEPVLDHLRATERLALARTYGIDRWIRSAVYDIVRREHAYVRQNANRQVRSTYHEPSQPPTKGLAPPLSQKDVDALGLDLAFGLAEARERVAGRYGVV